MAAADDDALFPLPSIEEAVTVQEEPGRVEKTFRPYDPNQVLLLPPSLDEWLPEGHLARFVSELVEEALDLSAIRAAYTEERGYPALRPAADGQAADLRVLHRPALVAGHREALLRRRRLPLLGGGRSARLPLDRPLPAPACGAGGPVPAGAAALPASGDGEAGQGGVGWDQAAGERQPAQGDELQADGGAGGRAGGGDRRDAGRGGAPGCGRGRALRSGRPRQRPAGGAEPAGGPALKIREAKQALEEEARRTADEKAAERADAQKPDEQAKEAKVETAMSKAVPKPKAQRNFTDPAARIMKMSDGAFHECYNGQAAVDAAYQVIVAADITQCAADAPSLLPMLEQTGTNCGRLPGQLLADSAYCAEESLKTLAKMDVEALIATGRWSHGQPPPPAPRGRIPANATARERMARKTRTKKGRAAYARRKAIVEPVFGQMTILQGARYLLLRGEAAVRAEWRLLSACHNLRKFFVVKGAAGLAGLAPA